MQDHAGPAQHRLQLLTGRTADGRTSDGRTVRRLAVAYLVAALGLAALLAAGALPAAIPMLAALRRGGVGGLALGSLLLALAGLVATGMMDAARVGRAARWPQIAVVVPLALAAGGCAWGMRANPLPLAGTAHDAYVVAGAALLLTFPLLVAERLVAERFVAERHVAASRLPEASDLRALLLLPVLVWPGAALLELAATLDAPLTRAIGAGLAIGLVAIAAELAARALGRAFLPPPPPEAARAAIRSTLARILADGTQGGIAAPIRAQLGIDFSRSWALAYVRAALPPLVLTLLLLGWSLSGVVLVGLDQRAVYERFGAPAAVLKPGMHLILPWPLGRARPVEFGAIHETGLTEAGLGPAERTQAEAPAPASADRLWETAHPAELAFLIAGESAGRQSFQTVSADLRVLYRVGLSDADALRAIYGSVAPAALVRAAAARLAGASFAGVTIEAVLGADREAMAERLRARLQADLAAFGSGIEVVAVVIEAIHPPAGAADAYHAVQAAEIAATASISAERGRALAVRAAAGQRRTELVDQARIGAADTTGGAEVDRIRFAADRDAAAAGGQAFLLERYFASVTAALARAPLTIIDNRITAAGGSVLDLRPPAAPGAPGTGAE